MNLPELKTKNVLILGAGKTGISVADFLIDKTKNVFISDLKNKPDQSNEKINRLISLGVKTEFGVNSDEFISRAELVVISPGISPNIDIVKKINLAGIPIISDIELASYFITKPIIAVTGTNGKTTTTSLIEHIINTSGQKAIACGNIGLPIIEAMQNKNIDYFVIEISSFQIYYSPTLSCDIAICLNITPDHLEWHLNYGNYIEAKIKLFSQQKENSWSIINLLDENLKTFNPKNKVFYFTTDKVKSESYKHISYFEKNILKVKKREEIIDIITASELSIIGKHNIENALAGISCATILEIEKEILTKALKSFKGIEHRLEFVKRVQNKDCFNDSKATNPESTIKAIEAISENNKEKNIIIILGGRDKKTELKSLIEAINKHISEVILFGEAKDRFYNELKNFQFKKNINIASDLEDAVTKSLNSKSDIVLFSPACSSFDMFKNYEERGNVFKEIIRKF